MSSLMKNIGQWFERTAQQEGYAGGKNYGKRNDHNLYIIKVSINTNYYVTLKWKL